VPLLIEVSGVAVATQRGAAKALPSQTRQGNEWEGTGRHIEYCRCSARAHDGDDCINRCNRQEIAWACADCELGFSELMPRPMPSIYP
jgi:hypothetical protein